MQYGSLLPTCFSRRAALGALGALALSTLVPGQLMASPADVSQPFIGSFTFAGGAKEREARETAIEDVVGDMNILVRSIAREKLKSSTVISETGRVSSDGKNLTIAVGTHSYTAPLDGRPVKVTGPSGDELELKYHVTDSTIEQSFSSDDGGRVNTFSVQNGNLVMKVRVHSSQLPKDLKYKLTYKRS